MKRNDGYALPFVLIVMVIICLVAVSILSFSLDNLKSQKASVERMQSQYVAEGKIEKVLIKIKDKGLISQSTLLTLAESEDVTFNDFAEIEVSYQPHNVLLANQEKDSLIFTVFSQSGGVQTECTIKAYGDIECKKIEDKNNFSYESGKLEYEYLSYEISSVSDLEGGTE